MPCISYSIRGKHFMLNYNRETASIIMTDLDTGQLVGTFPYYTNIHVILDYIDTHLEEIL